VPYGPTATEEFLRDVASRLSIPAERVDAVVAEERRYYYAFIERLADLYNDHDFQRNVVIVGTAANALALSRFVADDLNWLPFAAAITDVLDESQTARVRASFDALREEVRPNLVFETDTTRVRDRVIELVGAVPEPYGDALSPAFLLGSVLDRPLAAELKAGYLSVSYPVVNRIVTDQGYAGYRGGLHLATDILSVLVSNR
jgi:nitrogenase molybdenum-iron protein beta chain